MTSSASTSNTQSRPISPPACPPKKHAGAPASTSAASSTRAKNPRVSIPAGFSPPSRRTSVTPCAASPPPPLRPHRHLHARARHRRIHCGLQRGRSHPLPTVALRQRESARLARHEARGRALRVHDGPLLLRLARRTVGIHQPSAQGAMPWPCDLTERNPVRLDCIEAHADFLPTLGVAPILGRNFLPGDTLPNAPRTVLLSYRLWHSRYNRDPAILNQLIQIDGGPVRVVGILPPNFELPSAQSADLLLPRQVDVAAVRSGKDGETMRAFARLKPGVTIAQARAAVEPLFNNSLTFAPAPLRKNIHLEIRGLRDRQMHDAIPVARFLLAAVLAVLLIVCANVASLFLTRNAARERELAVRAALGASRGRLLRQSLTETLLLSLAGGIVGCALAAALLRAFIAIAPVGMPFLQKATLDLRILLAALALSLLSGLVCSILPALQRPRAVALTARTTGTGAQVALRRVLIVAQIACSVLLLSGAALLLRSFRNVEEQNLGLDAGGVLTANIVLSVQRYADQQKQLDFFTRSETALRA